MRSLQEEVYTQKEAEAAVGLRTDNGRRDMSKPMELEATMDVDGAQNK